MILGLEFTMAHKGHGKIKSHGKIKKTDGKLKKTHGKLNKTHGKLNKTHGKLKKTHGKLKKTHGKLKKTLLDQKQKKYSKERVLRRYIELAESFVIRTFIYNIMINALKTLGCL